MAAHRGISDEFAQAASRFKLGEGLTGQVAQTGQPVVMRDLSEYPGALKAYLEKERIQSAAVVPLIGSTGVMGTMNLATASPDYFDPAGLDLLMALGQQIAIGVEKLRLYAETRAQAEELRKHREHLEELVQERTEELRVTKDEYQSLVQNIPDAVYSALPDETGTTTFMSGRWEDWTGYAPEDFYRDHETWPKSIHPDDLGDAVGGYIEACRSGKEYVSEYRVIHKDTGQVRWVRDHGVPIKDEEGNVIQFDGIVTDITERKRAEEELARRVAELERFNRLAVGRELRMVELKRQINQLSEQLGKEPPYDVSFAEEG
jgi:PAS domain S-box-containing protein